MKKLYFTVLSLFTSLSVFNAQILTQSNHAPVIGETFRTTDVSSVGISPGSAGPSVTWDMSAISVGTTVSNYSVLAVPSASAAAYPSASLSVSSNTASNSFYSSSAASLKYWGGDMVISTFNINMNYTAAAVTATYSTLYNTSCTSAISGSLSAGPSISGTFTGTCTVIADGAGTLAMPTRTFTNVLRLKITQDIAFTTSFGPGTLTQVNYEYYHALSKTPLITISTATVAPPIIASATQTSATINTDYQYVGITVNSKEVAELNVFPNPANDYFNLTFVNENAVNVNVEITNAIGQTVKKENLLSSKGLVNHTFNVADLKAGVYFVKISVGEKSSVRKLTIQ